MLNCHEILPKYKLNNKERNCVRDFDKTFLFASYEYFCRSNQQKIVGKTKTEVLLDNRGHNVFGYWVKLSRNEISDKTHLI